MRKLILVPVLFLFLSACSLPNIFLSVEEHGGDLSDQAYALIATFDVVDAAALEFASEPTTPVEVVALLKRLRAPARVSVPLIAEAAKNFRAVRNKLESLEDPSTVEELTAVVSVLSETMESYSPVIQNFIDYFDSL